jgi:hypothetical protein
VVIECTGLFVGSLVERAHIFVAQSEGFILTDTWVVLPRKTLLLVFLVFLRANKGLHIRIFQKCPHIIVVAHEIDGESPIPLLFSKLGRYGLKFLYEGVAGKVARYASGSVIDDLDSDGREVISP